MSSFWVRSFDQVDLKATHVFNAFLLSSHVASILLQDFSHFCVNFFLSNFSLKIFLSTFLLNFFSPISPKSLKCRAFTVPATCCKPWRKPKEAHRETVKKGLAEKIAVSSSPLHLGRKKREVERKKKFCKYWLILYKSIEQWLNLNGSWRRGHSHAYNTTFWYLSRMQRICLSRYLELRWKYDLGRVRKHAYSYSLSYRKESRNISPLSSMDSGLEAFSRNPTHGSFSALTFQSTDLPIMWTNGSSRTKLDYCRGDDYYYYFHSRVKLTCLTTV